MFHWSDLQLLGATVLPSRKNFFTPMSTLIQSFQLKTKGPSFAEIIPGSQIIIRQLDQLILYNPQLRKIVKEFKLDECYFGQPATYFNSHYYEMNDNGVLSISVITGTSEQLALSKQLFP